MIVHVKFFFAKSSGHFRLIYWFPLKASHFRASCPLLLIPFLFRYPHLIDNIYDLNHLPGMRPKGDVGHQANLHKNA